MKNFAMTVAALSLIAAGPAYAASGDGGSNSQNASGGKQASLATANKLEQDLRTAGFTDVKVVAESFVVQAKSKDGDPVLLTVGPHGMAMFEAASGAASNANSNTSTSNTSTSGSKASGSSK